MERDYVLKHEFFKESANFVIDHRMQKNYASTGHRTGMNLSKLIQPTIRKAP